MYPAVRLSLLWQSKNKSNPNEIWRWWWAGSGNGNDSKSPELPEQDLSGWEFGARQVSPTIRTWSLLGAAWDEQKIQQVCMKLGVEGRETPLIHLLYSLFDSPAIKSLLECCQKANLSKVSPSRAHESPVRARSMKFTESPSKQCGPRNITDIPDLHTGNSVETSAYQNIFHFCLFQQKHRFIKWLSMDALSFFLHFFSSPEMSPASK